MLVKELREELAKYPEGAPVITTWEGTFQAIGKDNIYSSFDGAVVIDADNNFYKGEIKSGEKFKNSISFETQVMAH